MMSRLVRPSVLILALGLLGGGALSACDSSSREVRAEPSRAIGSAEARRVVAAGGLLVDVRTADEFADGHLDGAVNIPVDELRGRLAEVPRDREVIVYCRTGRRSANAAEILGGAGIKVRDLGKMSAW